MPTRRRRNNDGAYALDFKPALVFGTPSMDTMLNQFFLVEEQEEYDSKDNQMLYSSLGYAETTDNPNAKSIFSLETQYLNVNPQVRLVLIKGKGGAATRSFLVETEMGGRGIAIVMLQEVSEQNQVYCNIRFLPYSRLKDVLVNTTGSQIEVSIPTQNVIKLNVTLMPTNTGEILYRTHKTEINLENVTDAQLVRAKKYLEFQGAKLVAHFTGMMLKTTPEIGAEEGALTADFSASCKGCSAKEIISWSVFSSVIVFGGLGFAGLVVLGPGIVSWQAAGLAIATIGGLGKFGSDGIEATKKRRVNNLLNALIESDVEEQIDSTEIINSNN